MKARVNEMLGAIIGAPHATTKDIVSDLEEIKHSIQVEIDRLTRKRMGIEEIQSKARGIIDFRCKSESELENKIAEIREKPNWSQTDIDIERQVSRGVVSQITFSFIDRLVNMKEQD